MTDEPTHIATAAAALDDPYAALSQHLHGDGEAMCIECDRTTGQFQSRVADWTRACFGDEISADRLERGDRFLEETLELLQSGGYPMDRVGQLANYVWSRPAGEPAQEVGGVLLTLAAYCNAHDLDMQAAGETELSRVWGKVEAIRAKQAAKPVGSALPQKWELPTPTRALIQSPERDAEVRRMALEEAFAAIDEYPRAAPSEEEWMRYDEQIEHSQGIIRALIDAPPAAPDATGKEVMPDASTRPIQQPDTSPRLTAGAQPVRVTPDFGDNA